MSDVINTTIPGTPAVAAPSGAAETAVAVERDGRWRRLLSAFLGDDWEYVMTDYIDNKDSARSTKRTYRDGLRQFFKWKDRAGLRLTAVTLDDLVAWKQSLLDSGHALKTVNLYLVCVRRFYAWLEAKAIYPNVAKALEMVRKSQMEKGFVKMHLTDDEASALLEHFRERSARDYALINLMLRTGLRSIEVNRANVGDIKMRGGRKVLMVQGKGKLTKSDFVVLSPLVTGPLNDYLATRSDTLEGSPLFTCEGKGSTGRRLSKRMIQFIGKEGMKAIGLDDHAYSIHSLRHTAGVQILKNGGTQFDVQDVLRHASPVTSQIYLESIKEERRIESAPELLLDKSFNGKQG